MSSDVQICNLALMHIKQSRTLISNLVTDTGKTADVCREHYDVCRRFVQADHNWNFCTQRVALTDIGSPPATWSFRYDYPSSCLKFRSIQADDRTTQIPYVVELKPDGSGMSILTDRSQAVGVFTQNVTNAALFSPGFVTALSWYLASEIAPALSEDNSMQEAALTVYRNMLITAEQSDSNEEEADAEPASAWDRARLGGGTITING